jgi:hypothetical protein
MNEYEKQIAQMEQAKAITQESLEILEKLAYHTPEDQDELAGLEYRLMQLRYAQEAMQLHAVLQSQTLAIEELNKRVNQEAEHKAKMIEEVQANYKTLQNTIKEFADKAPNPKLKKAAKEILEKSNKILLDSDKERLQETKIKTFIMMRDFIMVNTNQN